MVPFASALLSVIAALFLQRFDWLPTQLTILLTAGPCFLDRRRRERHAYVAREAARTRGDKICQSSNYRSCRQA